ncbi:Serine/Threonine protein kinase and Signal Transduction Histidine Kinase (STHK) with GAF and PAS/PAC sensor [Plesiocystis pacifica SIR-1]|uniref:histidine kinase n=1 Tax=Plesiocystis pacifica SIR-1 TaxID=391625 RepID=A6G0B1_9BACT|nr:ATP-binding protein [Plesiocystis pacifica]EDM80808.1 Serine/Threonine protein kinase and Signal Transduction Histidine Kinase (STHK) with GAF and PAS/PAC sensor [Plesiocystis pacifica SIR-1]
MIPNPTGYINVTRERGSDRVQVFEAQLAESGRRVVVASMRVDNPELEARVAHEFAQLVDVQVDGLARALSLERADGLITTVFERPAGITLATCAEHRVISIADLLEIGAQLAEILARVHARGLLHRSIRPARAFIEADPLRVSLAGVGVRALLTWERETLDEGALLTEVLAYAAPEQTGRTNRGTDARSDLYSLGAVLYELLVGEPPFVCAGLLELVYAHLARTPEPAHARRLDVPDGLSRVLAKLLAKAPQERYQSATSLAADLRALQTLHAAGDDTRGFELDTSERGWALHPPTLTFGHERECARLRALAEQGVDAGASAGLAVVGARGMGKSTVLLELQNHLTQRGALVGQGSFRATATRPYSAIADAITQILEQLLSRDDESLAHWRARLQRSLGGVAALAVELVPTLAALVDPQLASPTQALDDAAAPHERVLLTVARVCAALRGSEPLVLVIEDLELAETSSLELLATLLAGQGEGSLLVLVSATPATEADDAHALRRLARLCREIGAPALDTVALAPLSVDRVATMVELSLDCPAEDAAALAPLLTRKTGGIPLLLHRLLSLLHEDGLLSPSPTGWRWDLDQVEAADLPGDLHEFMIRELRALEPSTAALLRLAACVGPEFDVETLAATSAQPLDALVRELYTLVEAGLLNPVHDRYRFAHEDIRTTALADCPARERASLHWRVAEHAMAAGSVHARAQLFAVAEHLEAALAQDRPPPGLDDPERRARVVDHLSRAGARALDEAAPRLALRYLERCTALLGAPEAEDLATHTGSDHARLAALHHDRARAFAALGQDRADTIFAALLDCAVEPELAVAIARARVAHLHLRGRSVEAVDLALERLAAHGCPLPRRPSRWRARAKLVRAWTQLRKLDAAAVLALPRCTDPDAVAVMALLDKAKNAAFAVDHNLYELLIAAQIEWTLRAGSHPTLPTAIAQLATTVAASSVRHVEGAVALAQLAQAVAPSLTDRPGQVRTTCAAQFFVCHLSQPFPSVLAAVRDAYPQALEAGDSLWAGYAGALELSMQLDTGTHLETLGRDCQARLAELRGRSSSEAQLRMRSLEALTQRLRRGELGDDPDRALHPAELEAAGASRYGVTVAATNWALGELLLGRPARALEVSARAFPTSEQVLVASWLIPRLAVTMLSADFQVRARAQHGEAPGLPAKLRRRAHALVLRWARHNPHNYAHYRELARGLQRLRARPPRQLAALRHLERARTLAAARGCRWLEGLSAELITQIALAPSPGSPDDALSSYSLGARLMALRAYSSWGARLPAERLREASLPDELADFGPREGSSGGRLAASTSSAPGRSLASSNKASLELRRGHGQGGVQALDYESVVRSVSAIAMGLGLDEVVAQVLRAALTNAGADHGALVLERNGRVGLVGVAQLAPDTGEVESEVFPRSLALDQAEQRVPTSLIRLVMRTSQALILDDLEDPANARFHGDPYLDATAARSLLVMPVRLDDRPLGVLALEHHGSPGSFHAARLDALQLIVGQAARALDRARIHGALLESETRWRSLVDGAPDLIALLGERGRVEFVNRSQGPRPDEHRAILERFAESSLPKQAWSQAVAAALEFSRGSELDLELPALAADTPARHFHARLAPLATPAEDHAQGRVIVIATEVTATKRAEAERSRLATQLRQQQRLEAIGTLASGVAHEINNPIQGILSYAELLDEDRDKPEVVGEFALEIRRESERVATIVRDLLTFSRSEERQPFEAVRFASVLDSMMTLLRVTLEHDRVELRIVGLEQAPSLRCRPQQLRQVLINLITNARDALNSADTGEGAPKAIEVRVTSERPNWLTIRVEDNGPGIPPEVLPRIFDPFYTTKGRHEGTGLGLALSHGIVSEHGGQLSVDSPPGRGACFRIDLPLAGPAEES